MVNQSTMRAHEVKQGYLIFPGNLLTSEITIKLNVKRTFQMRVNYSDYPSNTRTMVCMYIKTNYFSEICSEHENPGFSFFRKYLARNVNTKWLFCIK